MNFPWFHCSLSKVTPFCRLSSHVNKECAAMFPYQFDTDCEKHFIYGSVLDMVS